MAKRKQGAAKRAPGMANHITTARSVTLSTEQHIIAHWLRQNGWRMLVVFLLVAGSRTPNLAAAGLNYDEPTYLYWGQVIGADWEQRYIGAGWGGKQPLHTWAVALAEKTIHNPVVAGRTVSVLSGAVCAALLWACVEKLASERAAWFAALFYLVCPYTVSFDRVAMIDSFLSALAIGTLGGSLMVANGLYITGAAVLAVCFGGATLTKSIGWGFALLVPFAVLANPVPLGDLGKRRFRKHLHRIIGSAVAGVLLGMLIYHIIFGSSPAAELIKQFEAQYGKYTLSLNDLLGLPMGTWFANLTKVTGWLVELVTPPVLAVIAAGLITLPRAHWRTGVLAAWGLFPTIGQILIANRFYSRYILFSIPPLLMLAAIALDQGLDYITTRPLGHKRRPGAVNLHIAGAVVVAGLLVWPVLVTADKLFGKETARNTGYYALYDAAEHISAEASRSPQTIIVAYSPAPVEDGMAVLLHSTPGVRVLRVAPLQGLLTVFNPQDGVAVPSSSLDPAGTRFAALKGAEQTSWLAGKIMPVRSFPGSEGKEVVLYQISFDESFR